MMRISHNDLKCVAALAALYSAAHGLLLFSKVVMWDGRLWTMLLKQKHYDILFQYFGQAGLPHIPFMYRLVDALGDPVFYSNVLQFSSWLIAGLCVYLILRNFVTAGDAFVVAALYLLLPIFIVRFELTVLTYSLSNMFFFLAVYLYLLSEKMPKKILAVPGYSTAILFFIFSFFTNSFLVFYYGFVSLLLLRYLVRYEIRFDSATARLTAKWFLKHSLLILLPIIFYIAQKLIIGAPYGIYKNYNLFVFLYPGASIGRTAFLLVDRIWQSIVYGFFWPILASISVLQRKVFAAIFMGTGIVFYLFLRNHVFVRRNGINPPPAPHSNAHLQYFLAGCALFVLGFVPYILVGESPNPYGHGFDMRHGLLLPLGSALIIVSLLHIFLLSIKWHLPAIAIVFSLFVTFNVFNYYSIDMDGYKQLGIIESLKSKFETKEISSNAIIVFNDKLPLYNLRNRELEDSEYTAYVYEASGSEEALGTFLGNDLSFTFKVKGYKDYPSDKELEGRLVYADIVSSSVQEPTFTNWLKLKKADLFGSRTEFNNLIKDILAVNVVIPSRQQSWLEARQ